MRPRHYFRHALARKSYEMSGLLDILSDPKAYIQTQAQKIEEDISDYSKSQLSPELYAKASELVKKEGDKLTSQATSMLTDYASQYAAKPEVQNKAITGSIDAFANKAKELSLKVADIYRVEGIGGVYRAYPMPFYITGGVVGLLTLRFILGGRKTVYVAKPA